MNDYDTVLSEAETEFVEKRSRFICAIAPASSQGEAMAFIERRRALHYDARHTVFAYLLQDGACRYSDDGEPQGTGGMPALEVLKRSGLADVCVAVTRYFGGILLGAGGLTRAYSNGAALAVKAAQRVTICACVRMRLSLDYPRYNIVSRLLPECGAELLESSFTDRVTLIIRLRKGDVEGFERTLTEVTGAAVVCERLGEEFAPMVARGAVE